MSETTTHEVHDLPAAVFEGTAMLPRLSADDRAELRSAAYPILAAARMAASTVEKLANGRPQGFWYATVITAASALSAMASGLCLLGASVALVLSTDDQAPAPRDNASAQPAANATGSQPDMTKET